MMKLKENEALPLLLCSNRMVPNFPAFHCDKDTTNVTDLMLKMKVLEQSVSGYMKTNNEQLQILTDTIAKSRTPMIPRIASSGMENEDTPGTKKRKVDETMQTKDQPMEGITPIGMNFVNAAKHQMMNQGQMFPPLNYQKQQERVQNQNQNKTTPRRKPALVYGNAKKGTENEEQFQFSADVNLVASGVSKDATKEQLKDFIMSKGIKVTDIELLTNFHKEESRSYTYRIAIKPEDYEKALNPEVWPYRVGVRPFKQKRNQYQQNSWQQQSGQAGGNVMMSQGNNQRRNQPSGMMNQPSFQPSGTAASSSQLDTSNRYVVSGFETEVSN